MKFYIHLLLFLSVPRLLWATDLVSVNAAGTDSGNNSSEFSTITPDGRFVGFNSRASDLVANDSNGFLDVFVRDLQAGITTLVSVNAAGTTSGNNESLGPQFTPDGRFVTFHSRASDLVVNDNNGFLDIFVRDLQAGITTLVSVNAAGTDSGNGESFGIQITPDGQFVAFSSRASDLVTNDNNERDDVFARDLQASTTTLVSINAAGIESGNDRSGATGPQITPDGRFVTFHSRASDLVANDNNERDDVFVRDLQAGTTTLVSVNTAGTDSGNGTSLNPRITPDGRFVTFTSRASDLVANDNNGNHDVFVRDLQAGTTTLVSVNAAGTDSGDSDSTNPQITPDGRFVTFGSQASDLVTNDSNECRSIIPGIGPPTFSCSDIFVRDLQAGTTTLVSVNATGTDSGNDGSPPFPLGPDPQITPDGRFVTFTSQASDLVANDNNGDLDAFIRDLQAGTTTLVSINAAGTDSGNDLSFSPRITPDGWSVTFISGANDLVANDSNGARDVFWFFNRGAIGVEVDSISIPAFHIWSLLLLSGLFALLGLKKLIARKNA